MVKANCNSCWHYWHEQCWLYRKNPKEVTEIRTCGAWHEAKRWIDSI